MDREPVTAISKRHGVSEQTIYTWRKRGGFLASDVRRLKLLQAENARLKKLVAERDLEIEVMKEVASKNVWSAPPLQGFRSAVGSSLRKCIRPLASGLLLQPGRDVMRAHRSQQMVRAQEARFFDRAYDAPINCSDISPLTSQLMNVTLRRRPVRSVHRASVGA